MDKALLSYTEIEQAFGALRNKHFVTNFFKTKPEVDYLIGQQQIQIISLEHIVYIIVQDHDFLRMFYMAADLDALSATLGGVMDHYKGTDIITEIVNTREKSQVTSELMANHGCTVYTTLMRMSKPRLQRTEQSCPYIQQAVMQDKGRIQDIFDTYFDPYAEQIPHDYELERLISNNCIYYYTDNGEIQGFIIFEINGFTLHLRYWFVHPHYRDKKIGSRLMDVLLSNGETVKRELFWVIDTNENAIKRYEHYGFKKEDLINTIFINKNIQYER